LGESQPAAAGTSAPETVDDVVAALPASGPVVVPACPLMHATGLFTALGTLRQGGCVVTLVGLEFDAVELLDTIERERAGAIAIVGDAFARPLVRALDAEP